MFPEFFVILAVLLFFFWPLMLIHHGVVVVLIAYGIWISVLSLPAVLRYSAARGDAKRDAAIRELPRRAVRETEAGWQCWRADPHLHGTREGAMSCPWP